MSDENEYTPADPRWKPLRTEMLRLMDGWSDEDKLVILELLRVEVQYDLFAAKLYRSAGEIATETMRRVNERSASGNPLPPEAPPDAGKEFGE